ALEVDERGGVAAGEAGVAERSGLLDRGLQPLERQVAKRVDAEVLADLGDRVPRADQLLAVRHVDPVVTREPDRRARDPEVDLLRAGLADQRDEAAARRAADERVIHHHDALALDDLADRVVLDPDPEVTAGLRRVDEGAADVMVPDQPQLERDAARLAVAERGRVRRVRNAEDAVRVRRLLDREPAPERSPRAVHARAEDVRVRTREIDQLEDARRRLRRRDQPAERSDDVALDLQDLARLEVAHVLGADQVERARLARDDVAAAPAPEDERAEAPRVPRRVQRLADREDQRERADQPGERFADLLVRGRVARTRDQVDYDLRVDRRLEE